MPASADWPRPAPGRRSSPSTWWSRSRSGPRRVRRGRRARGPPVAFEAAGASGSRALRDHDRRLRRDATLLANGRRRHDLPAARLGPPGPHGRRALPREPVGPPTCSRTAAGSTCATLASREARQVSVRPEQPSVLVPYALDAEGDSPERHLWHVANGQAPHVLVRRLDRRVESVWGPYADRPLRAVEPARVAAPQGELAGAPRSARGGAWHTSLTRPVTRRWHPARLGSPHW